MSKRSQIQAALCVVGLLVLLAACSGRRLPPGTPPPEYEPPVVSAWPVAAESADAGPERAPITTPPPIAPDAGSGAELSLDAGPR